MYLMCVLLCIIGGQVFSARSPPCDMKEHCFAQLKSFTQADKFHVYTTVEEITTACRLAQEARLCIAPSLKCIGPREKISLSPILQGSSKLLKEFCGIKSKKRPCCALKTAYLEHSNCYLRVKDRLEDCNDKYRKSVGKILELKSISEQNKQRYCSQEWLGSCIKRSAQRICGKIATQVIKSYMMKAARHHKNLFERSYECNGTLFGLNEASDEACRPKRFDNCGVVVRSFNSSTYSHDVLMTLCSDIQSSPFECLNSIYKRCLFSKSEEKFKLMFRLVDNRDKEHTCNLTRLNKFIRGEVDQGAQCLVSKSPTFSKCNVKFPVMTNDMNFQGYLEHYCSLTALFVSCLIDTATEECGHAGKTLMQHILNMASANNQWKCF